jgi:hypothetical protein
MNRAAISAIRSCIEARVPALVWGPPGTGKTSVISRLAAELGLHLEVVIASIREPADFGGLPVVKNGGVYLHPPAWARRLAELPPGKGGLLFLDEITTTPPAVQAALLRVILERVVGDLPLPDSVAVVAAGNPTEQAAGGWELGLPLANRFVHIEWPLDHQAWLSYMLSRRDGCEAGRAQVAAFIRVRPHLLLQLPKDGEGPAFPSPRSWEKAAVLLSRSPDEEVALKLVCGAVGPGAAAEFAGWRRNLDLPDPEELLADPGKYRTPARADRQFALLAAVAAAALGRPSPHRYRAAWEVVGRAAEDVPDAAVVAAAALARAREENPELEVPLELIDRLFPILQKAGLL